VHVTLRAPAKINFGLEILERRSDGYHEIETIFLPIDLWDDVRIERTNAAGIEVRVSGAELPEGADNLAHRAAERTLRALEQPGGALIQLHKRIPVAAGLGGGSSDAAAVLRGLEQLCGKHLPRTRRHSLARELGADVPFFLDPTPSRALGIGDRLTPLRDIPMLEWVLVSFPFGISTPKAYAAASAQLTLPRRGSSIAALLGPSGVVSRPPNDLELVARSWHPEIGSAQSVLIECGATMTGMSGSGPTVYGHFESRERAERAVLRAESLLPAGQRPIAVRSPASSQGPESTLDTSWEARRER